MGVGIAIGIAIGVAIGVAMGNIPVGVAIGVALGVAMGSGIGAKRGKADPKPTGKGDDPRPRSTRPPAELRHSARTKCPAGPREQRRD